MKKVLIALSLVFFCFHLGISGEVKEEEMVVTATKVETPLRLLPLRVDVISSSDIENSVFTNLGDLFSELFPGHVHKYPDILTSVGIRGFRTDTHGVDIKGRVLLLIDGHRAGTGNLAEIPLENIERIEIIRGPGSLMYGSSGMGGVINVITKKGKGKPYAGIGGEFGSWDMGRGYFYGGGALKRFDFTFGGGFMQRNNYQIGDDEGTLHNTDYNDKHFSLQLGYKIAEKHRISIVGQYFSGFDVGSPGATYSPSINAEVDRKRRYIAISYDGGGWKNCSWHSSYYFVKERYVYKDPAWNYSSRTTTETQGLRNYISIPTSSFGFLTAGFDWDNVRLFPTTWSPRSKLDNYAFFAQEELNIGKFIALFGARYDYFDEEVRKSSYLPSVKEGSESYDHITWKAGLGYFILPSMKLWLSAGTGFRTPSPDELAGMINRGWSKVVGNSDLDPEECTTYELGLDFKFKDLDLKAGIFYTIYDDKIAGGFPTCVGGDCTWTTYKNVDGATYKGWELKAAYNFEAFSMRFKPFVNVLGYFTKEIEDSRYENQIRTDEVPYVSDWNLTGGWEVEKKNTFLIKFSTIYVGPQKVIEWNWTKPNYGQAKDKGGFTICNLKIRLFPIKNTVISFGVENLFDKKYSFVDYYPMPGRTYKMGVEMKL